MKHTLLICS